MAAYEILLPLALILCLTKVFALGAHRIGLPAVIGMLLAGLLIGFFKYIPSESFHGIFFGAQIREWLSVFAKIGVVLIMFSTGLSTNLKTLKASGGASVVITIFGVIVPMALGTLVSYLFGVGEGWLSHLFYGAILTATSVSVTVATLKELGKLESKAGTSIVAAAVIDDVIGIIVLSVLTGFTSSVTSDSASIFPGWWENAKWWLVVLKIICFFVLAVAFGLFLRKRFDNIERRFPHNRRVPILAICVCFTYAYVAEKIFGVADITGAYVAGLILGGTLRETPYVERKTDVLGYMVFSPIFFATIGMYLDFSGFSGAFAGFGLCYVLVAVAGKLFGCGAAARICGFSAKDSYRVGCGMMVRAEVVLICTDKGITSGLVSPAVYPFVFMIIIITSVLAPLLLKFSYKGELPLQQDGAITAETIGTDKK